VVLRPKVQRIGQGRENAKQYLREHPEMLATLEAKIRANAGLVADSMLAGPDDAAPTEMDDDIPPAEDDAPAPSKSKKAS
jgi:recombination protein RecA